MLDEMAVQNTSNENTNKTRNGNIMLDNFLIEGKIVKIQHRYSIYTIIWSYSLKTGSTTLV